MTASRPEVGDLIGRAGPLSERVRSKRPHLTSGRTMSRLALLAACAVAVYVFEGLLPMPIPWARLGLSNVVIVVCLFGYGLEAAFLVNLVRIVSGNLLLGLVASPAFLFSAAGSMAALLVMGTVRWKLVPPFSVLGTSLLGAVTNNLVQVLIFFALFAPSAASTDLLGVFILLGVGVGSLTGAIAGRIVDKVGLARYSALG